MVSDAEKYKAEDDKQRERVTSKNDLEAYAFQVICVTSIYLLIFVCQLETVLTKKYYF